MFESVGVKKSQKQALTGYSSFNFFRHFLFSDLTEENRSLKKYIDNLMIVLMEKFPEVLENLASSQ